MNKGEKRNVLIVIPTLGERKEYLEKTINSIKKQTYPNYDIVIVYPIKNKFVTEIADSIDAVKIPDPGGLSAAVNAGIAAAKPYHEYISWIGDDDLLSPDSLEKTVSALTIHPNSPVAYGYCNYIDDKGDLLFVSKAGALAPWLMTWGPNLLPCPGALFRKNAILTVGGFDESNKHSMDLDMFLKLKKLGKFINTKHVLASFRWHRASMSVASRDKATREAEQVKYKYTPRYLRPLTPLWFIPVRYLSKYAARKLSQG